MREIKRYILTHIGLFSRSEKSQITTDDLCKYADVAQIIQRNAELEQRNKELEAELARLRQQKQLVFLLTEVLIGKILFSRML